MELVSLAQRLATVSLGQSRDKMHLPWPLKLTNYIVWWIHKTMTSFWYFTLGYVSDYFSTETSNFQKSTGCQAAGPGQKMPVCCF